MHFVSSSFEQTENIASEFALTLKGGELIEFVGDLGTGKTTFVRGMARALGASVRVKSPSFTIMNEYPVAHLGIKKIVHLDLYRFKDQSELGALELDEYLKNDTIVCIEWPDIFGKSPFEPSHRVRISHVDEHTREVDIEEL